MEATSTTEKRVNPSILSIGMSNHDLCTRCGTCVGACPTEAIRLSKESFPELIPEKCTECGLCERACPGARVDYQELTETTFGHRNDPNTFDGLVQRTFVGYCTDDAMRNGGAGGGIVTALCWDLLNHGDVDGCIVARMRKDKPWIGEPFVARTHEELLESQGSKYMIIPVNSIFQEIRRMPGRYAYVALPCQVHGFRMLAREDPVLRSKIHSVIGLFCGGSLEPNMVTELLEARGISLDDISDFQFRGGEWPGKMRAVMKNGDIRDLHYSNYKDGAYNYFTSLYMPQRCQTCLDGSGQFSDISISDAWTRDEEGRYRFKAHSRLLARTDIGVDIMLNAIERGTIKAHEVTEDPDYITHKIQTKRKGVNAPLRTQRRLRKGGSAPLYDRPPPDANFREAAQEQITSLLLWLGRYRWFRYPLMKFLTSKAAVPLIKFRLWRKNRKYRRS